jgi:polyphosphate kinase
VEAVVSVTDPDLQSRLQQILAVNLADDTLAWELQPDGRWEKVATKLGISTHRRLQELAIERARRRREPDPLSPVRG